MGLVGPIRILAAITSRRSPCRHGPRVAIQSGALSGVIVRLPKVRFFQLQHGLTERLEKPSRSEANACDNGVFERAANTSRENCSSDPGPIRLRGLKPWSWLQS